LAEEIIEEEIVREDLIIEEDNLNKRFL